MLIDWLTLRFPLSVDLGQVLHDRIMSAMGKLVRVSPSGELIWEKLHVDFDELRSDSSGLFWQVTADADSVRYLTIGGSPSSIVNCGVNVFGTLDIESAARTLIEHAGKALDAVLPHFKLWQCRRLDITANYDMGNSAQVKEALSMLLATDAPRRRSNSDRRGGDSVYWNPSSDLQAGKAYHKGAHLRYQRSKGNISIDDDTLALADRLLRFELKLGARWFRRLARPWHSFTENELEALHGQFFKSVIGGGDLELNDMDNLLELLEQHAPTKGRALAALRTWSLIKHLGYTQTANSMPRSTFALHCKYLRACGLSSADLSLAKVLPFRRRTLYLHQPVTSWDELRRIA